MQESIQTAQAPGTLFQQRYLVEDLLGKGGFGAVYLVRDQEAGGEFAALKELKEQGENEKKRLLFECSILQRLDHPSLPQFKDMLEEQDRLYILMEYIQGPSLEILRKKQPGQRFSFARVATLIQPIIEAVTYLHQQHPPLLHRDIKPGNIILSESDERTVLVDFGIAKEYDADATTTAIRHCSPGYSAPEQYGGMGTNLRVDVYGLGATCYTLLTGSPPIDALQRLTSVASRGVDPLMKADTLAPDIPAWAADAIHTALALNYEQRFATAAEFWQALTAAEGKPTIHPTETPGSVSQRTVHSAGTGARVNTHPGRLHSKILTLAAILLLLLAGLTGSFWLIRQHSTTAQKSIVPTAATSHTTPVKAASSDYPLLASSYKGTLDNLLTSSTTTITLSNLSQHQQSIQGTFLTGQTSTGRPFSGVVDTAKHILVTVSGSGDQAALFFSGVIRSDNNLAGNYCTVDAAGQCSGNAYGLWSVSP